MAIKSVDEMQNQEIQIDLTGSDGNAFALLGYAKTYCEQLGRDYAPIRSEMMSGNYDNLVAVFDREFGEFVTLYR